MNRKYLSKKIARRYRSESKQASRRNKTAGEVRFVRDRSQEEGQRDIPEEGFDWQEDALPDLSRVLWGLSCSLGHLHSSYRKFTKMKSSEFSPDGKLGGRGYVQTIQDMRQSLAESMEVLSNCVDTLDDEVKAPHWQEDELTEEEQQRVEENIEEAEEIAGNPEEFAEEEYEKDIEDALEDVEEGDDE